MGNWAEDYLKTEMGEWSAVGGYWDILCAYMMAHGKARLNGTQFTDDLESFKVLLDHCYPKLVANEKRYKDRLPFYKKYVEKCTAEGKEPLDIIAWFDYNIEVIEGVFTVFSEKRMDVKRMNKTDYNRISGGMKLLRSTHRELLLCMQFIGAFDRMYVLKNIEDLKKK